MVPRTALGTAADASCDRPGGVYAVSIGWWRTNGTVEYFRHLGFPRGLGTGGLPENFVYNTGSEQHSSAAARLDLPQPARRGLPCTVALLLAIGPCGRRLALVLGVVAAAGLL